MTYTWDAVDVIVFSSAVKEGVPFVKKEHDTGILSFCSTANPICCNSCIGWGSLLPLPTSKILLFCIGITSRLGFIDIVTLPFSYTDVPTLHYANKVGFHNVDHPLQETLMKKDMVRQ